MSETRRHAAGRRGEQLAASHLRRRGYALLARNARTRHGEIDLIAYRRETLIFVEVKTRLVGARQSALREDQLPLAGLGARQRVRLRQLALAWLGDTAPRPRARAIRFDAIGVVIDAHERLRRLDHLENAW